MLFNTALMNWPFFLHFAPWWSSFL